MAIAGNLKEGRAPSPSRGLSRALYEAIEACGDVATEKEIIDILPASDIADHLIDRDRIHANLLTSKSNGYFVHEPQSNTWRIAPLSYYEARRTYLSDPNRTRSKRDVKNGRNAQSRTVPVIRYVHDWRYSLAFGAVCFAIGFVFGGDYGNC